MAAGRERWLLWRMFSRRCCSSGPYCSGHWIPGAASHYCLAGVVHSVKILSYWQNKAALRLQSGLAAVVSNKRQLVRQSRTAPLPRHPDPAFFTYSALGPAATRALPASLAAYLEKFFTKREARSLALCILAGVRVGVPGSRMAVHTGEERWAPQLK